MIVHYQHSLLRPHVPILQHLQARPVLDAQRVPIIVEGTRSMVAKLQRTDGTMLALRIPTETVDVETWKDRYGGLRRLALTKLKNRIPDGLEVIPSGIDIEGTAPISVLVMDWIQGPTLASAVRRACQTGNTGVLRALATALIDLANSFRQAQFAHQHLSPSNLIISTNGSLVAIGLDNSTWTGGPRGIDGEGGAAAYRHPESPVSPLDADAFATLVLYTSLRVLADAPDLAAIHGDPDPTNDAPLLFSSWDLADPGVAESFADAAIRATPETREFVDALSQACLSPASEVERWLSVVPKIVSVQHVRIDPAASISSGWDISQAVNRARTRFEATQLVPEEIASEDVPVAWRSWQQPASVESWPMAPVDTPEPIVPAPEPAPPVRRASRRRDLLTRNEPSRRESPEPRDGDRNARDAGVPPETGRLVSQASSVPQRPSSDQADPLPIATNDRESERNLLREALRRGDEIAVAQIWPLVANDPIGRTMSLQVEESNAAGIRGRIRQGAARNQDVTVLELAAQAVQRKLPLDPATRKLVKSAQERVTTREELERALATGSREDLVSLAVSGNLVALGDTDRASLRMVLRALEWPTLERALATDDDQIIVGTYNPEIFEQGRELTGDARNRIDLAYRRVAWRADVRHALKSKNPTSLEDLFQKTPPQAMERLSTSERRRARRLIEQQRALNDLRSAVRDKDDVMIVTALNHVERVGARIEDRHTWNAIQTVVERSSLVEDILTAATTSPIDIGRLAQLVPAAKTLGVGQDPRLRGEFDLEHLEGKLVRHAHTTRIRAAIARDDDTAIVVAAVPDPYGVLEGLKEEERARIAAAILARRRVDRSSVSERFDRS